RAWRGPQASIPRGKNRVMHALFLQTISFISLIGKQKKWGDLRLKPAIPEDPESPNEHRKILHGFEPWKSSSKSGGLEPVLRDHRISVTIVGNPHAPPVKPLHKPVEDAAVCTKPVPYQVH
ncbi:MAG: hypothetical protein J0M09_16320, partial [Xanthomonadales bacterium]|nr:hypothetical protein [Xanthomonadales bacterium]